MLQLLQFHKLWCNQVGRSAPEEKPLRLREKFTQKGPEWDLNLQPSYHEVWTTAPTDSCHVHGIKAIRDQFIEQTKIQRKSRRLCPVLRKTCCHRSDPTLSFQLFKSAPGGEKPQQGGPGWHWPPRQQVFQIPLGTEWGFSIS